MKISKFIEFFFSIWSINVVFQTESHEVFQFLQGNHQKNKRYRGLKFNHFHPARKQNMEAASLCVTFRK